MEGEGRKRILSIVRQPVLQKEEEKQLEKDLKPLWEKGLTGPKIVERLDFGVEGTDYEKLKLYHVYFYRRKFNLPRRRKSPIGESRYKHKQRKFMPWKQFIETLEKKTSKHTFYNERKRSYVILHYWTPLRKSEIYERTINDFEIEDNALVIHLLRKKKTYLKTVTDEPLQVPLAFPKMDEVVEWLVNKKWESEKFNLENRPWNITHTTAWNYVKNIFPGYYPHFFRFNWITDAVNDPETSLGELRAKTGLHLSTLNTYIIDSERMQKELDRRKLKRMDILTDTKEIEEKKIPRLTTKIQKQKIRLKPKRPEKKKIIQKVSKSPDGIKELMRRKEEAWKAGDFRKVKEIRMKIKELSD